jgi:T5SS/PEP-CTERM-associated repeat protein
VTVDSGSLTAGTMALVSDTLGDDIPDQFNVFGGTATITGAATATDFGVDIYSAGGTLRFSDGLTLSDRAALDVADGGRTTAETLTADGTIEVEDAGSTLTVVKTLTLGSNGDGTLTLAKGGALIVDGAFDMAEKAGSTSAATIGDAGATLKIRGDWRIGVAGTANATVNGAVTVAVGGAIEVGADAGGNGTLTVSDTGTMLNGGAGDVTIGGQGTGTTTVENGALFDAATSDVTVGEGQDSIGTLTVTGQGSEMEAGSLTVASESKLQTNNGQTTFTQATVAEGGALDVVSDLTIGETQGSNGRVTVTDTGSTLTVGGNADIGPAGKGLLAIDGAAVTVHGDVSLGEESGGSGKLTVAAGSVTCAGDIMVGGAGSGSILVNLGGSITPGSLSIPSGATDTITLGESGGGKGTLTVDGALSSVTSFGLTVGEAGSGTFKATNGAAVDTTGGADVAEQAIGATSTVTVSGRSQWEVGGDLSIGAGGVGAATVSSAGLVDAKGDITLGEDKGASGTLTVTGVLNVTNVGKVASTVEWGGTLAVGESGFGTLSVASGAVVKPTSGGTGIVEIAAQAGSTGTVSVSGTGSRLSGTTLSVGGTARAAGGSGTLSIGAGSEASFAGTTVWNTGKIMDAGTLTLGGVVGGAGKLQIESGGTLKLERSDSAASPVFVAGAESETLDLVANHLPAAHIVGFAANDFVFVSGLATSDTIETSYTATTAIVDFLQLGKTVGHLDFAETSGQHDVFQYNAATRALTLAAPT